MATPTGNYHFVRKHGANTVVLQPKGVYSRDDVVNLCAWLLLTSDATVSDVVSLMERIGEEAIAAQRADELAPSPPAKEPDKP